MAKDNSTALLHGLAVAEANGFIKNVSLLLYMSTTILPFPTWMFFTITFKSADVEKSVPSNSIGKMIFFTVYLDKDLMVINSIMNPYPFISAVLIQWVFNIFFKYGLAPPRSSVESFACHRPQKTAVNKWERNCNRNAPHICQREILEGWYQNKTIDPTSASPTGTKTQ